MINLLIIIYSNNSWLISSYKLGCWWLNPVIHGGLQFFFGNFNLKIFTLTPNCPFRRGATNHQQKNNVWSSRDLCRRCSSCCLCKAQSEWLVNARNREMYYPRKNNPLLLQERVFWVSHFTIQRSGDFCQTLVQALKEERLILLWGWTSLTFQCHISPLPPFSLWYGRTPPMWGLIYSTACFF